MTITICLNMIVKNESKIITRLLDGALPIIDNYCICDTGSTDNTKEIIKDYFNKKDISGVIFDCSFQNFGYNRTEALKAAKNMSTYILLLDADMKLHITPDFNKETLIHPVYTFEQGNSEFKYTNTRLVKGDLDIKCIGPTHEYYSFPLGINAKKLNTIFITDIGDGGCKDNKFIRDIRLLQEAIEDDPNNGRYYFYLANSYYNINKIDKAINAYKKRIELGGWKEEVWYSYYRLGLCYNRKKQPQDAIKAWLDGYNFYPRRAENIYEIVKYYRITGQHQLSYHFYQLGKSIPFPEDNTLFLHKNIYDYMFDYELSIIAYYLTPRPDVLDCYMNLLNRHTSLDNQHLLSNFKFYCRKLKHKKCISINDSKYFENYIGSTPSIIPYKNGYLTNIRYIDYKIERNGIYTYHDGQNVHTQNTMVIMDKDFKILKRRNFQSQFNNLCRVRGIEDVKIIDHEGEVYFIGTGQLPQNHYFRMFFGKYNIKEKILQCKMIPSPYNSECEKNWALFSYKNSIHFIYKWYPLTIGTQCSSYPIITEKKVVPPIFKMMSGSSNGFLYENEYWFVTHLICYSKPRHYYHCIIILDGESLEYKRHSRLFTFDGESIEFCLSIIVQKKTIILSHSSWDSTSLIKIYDKEELLADIFDNYIKPSIALLIPVCSRNQNYNSITDIPLLKYLLPSFLKTQNNNYTYTFYIGIDSSDKIYLNYLPLLNQYSNVKLHCIILDDCEHKPAHAWNKLFERAYKNGHDYFYQLGDDIELLTPWTELFIRILKMRENKGVVGGSHDKNYKLRLANGSPPVIENAFVHRTHYQLFKTFFNKEIENWYCDDWITEVYKPEHSTFCQNVKVENHIIDSRYIICHMREKIKALIKKDREKII